MKRSSLLSVCVVLTACGGGSGESPKAGPSAETQAPAPTTAEPSGPSDKEQAAERYAELSSTMDSIEQGKTADAAWLEGELREVVRLDPSHQEARFNLAKIQELRGDTASAQAVYDQMHEEDPTFAPAAEEVARKLLSAGEGQRAESLYRVNIQNDPKNLTSRLALARILLSQRQYKEAVELCREVLQRDARSAEAFRVLARAFYERKNFPMAELVIGRGLKIHPKDTQLQYTLARVLFARKDLVAGVSKLKEVVALDPDWLKARAELADIALEYRDYANAAQQYEAILKGDPKNFAVKLSLAVSYGGMGRADQAETLYRELLTEKPGDIDVQWNLATLLYRQGKFEESIALLNELDGANEPGLSAKVKPLLDKVRREKNDAAALAKRREREEQKAAAIGAACTAVAQNKPVKGEAIGNDQERVESAWQLIVEAQQLIQEGNVPDGESRVACAFGILPDSEGVKKEACAPMRVTWTQMLYQLGRVDDAIVNTKEGLKCDPENPELLLIEQQLQELKAAEGGTPSARGPR